MNIDPVILNSILFLGALGLVLGLGFGFASKKFSVDGDARESRLLELLPGLNCGACGYPRCSAYASALLIEKAEIDRCTVAKADVNDEISSLLGKEVKKFQRNAAVILCAGGEACKDKMDYRGIKDCAIASTIFNGNKECGQGCPGYGDCIKVCVFNAIRQKRSGTVPEIDIDKCTACGLCVKACPKNLIRIIPCNFLYHILCQSQNKAAEVKHICSVGCTGCSICVKACPKKDIVLKGNLAYMKYKECTNCGICAEKCPTKSVVKLYNKIEEKNILKTEVVLNFNESAVNEIVKIHRDSFPAGWEYDDDRKYYSGLVKNKENVIILLKDKGKSVGFLVAIPHNDAVLGLKDADKFMSQDPTRYYIETIAILAEYRGKKGSSAMFHTLEDELKSGGIKNISLHARVSNSFSGIIRKRLKVTKIRRIDKWKYYKYNEPTDYIEATFV